MSGLRAGLTGATGFFGVHLLPALIQAGFKLRILARAGITHPAWQGLEFETVRGSLEDAGALAALAEGADLVVHAAGLIKALTGAEFLRVNRDGAAALAAITRRVAPQARLLLISSLAAREPGLSGYACSKHAGEAAVQAAFADVPAQLAILRPPAIYGPWDRATLPLFRSTQRRFVPVAGRGRAAVIHASEAAGAVAALAQRWQPGTYTLADPRPEGYTMRELLLAGATASGGTPRLLQLPDAMVLAAGRGAGLWAQLTGKAQVFGPGKSREMVHADWSVSPAELLPAEIFTPRIGLAEGFADTVAWYRQAGWL